MLFLLELDGEMAAHLVNAIARYRRDLRRWDAPAPPGLGDVESLMLKSARRRQESTCRPVPSALVDDEPMTPLLLTREQTAGLLNMHERTIDRLRARGELPALRIGGLVRFRRSDVEDYVARMSPGPLADRVETKSGDVK